MAVPATPPFGLLTYFWVVASVDSGHFFLRIHSAMTVAARRKAYWTTWLPAALLMAAGCGGPSGVPRLPVYGTVVDSSGEKIDGSISFVPDQGRSGPSAIASLVKGAYRFDKTNGPTAGPNRVIVIKTASKEPPLKPAAPAKRQANKGATAGRQAVEWTFSRDVAEKGPFQFDFQLQ